MAQSTPIQSVKEHKKITDDIDDAYMGTVRAAATLNTFLAGTGGGSKRESFLSFYDAFFGLFSHTRHMNGMDELDSKKYSLVDELEGWFRDARLPKFKRLPDAFISDGIDLFTAYQKKLILKGILTLTR